MKRVRPVAEVLILGAFSFPEGCAASNNLRGHVRAIQSAGLTVGLLADQMKQREADKQPDGTFAYCGISYWAVQRLHSCPRLHRLFNTLFAWRDDRLAWLAEQESLAGVKAILVYPSSSRTVPLLLRLRRLCRRHGIQLLVYVVEWHELERYGMRRFALGAADGEVQRRWVNPRLDGVLCISEYLQAYYRAKGVRTALLPPLLDLSDAMWMPVASRPEPMRTGMLKVIFSGSPIRERHDLILRAVLKARCQGIDVVLEYLGCTRDAIATMRGVGEDMLHRMGDAVRFLGRLPFEAVPGILASASFGLLFREDSKWSKACFPSKVPEFLALGVPLLCNITSDLHRYLKDGVNALIASELSVDSLVATLRRAATLRAEHYQEMRAAARATAQAFDGRKFGQTYRDLLAPSV